MLKGRSAFSLIELLVFVSILGIFFIMAASVVTVSLRNMKFNENKIKATHHANQLSEWIKIQREINWGGDLCNGCSSPGSFTQAVTRQGNTTTYCFNSDPIGGWQSLGPCASYGLNSLFKREVSFSVSPVGGYVSEVNTTITISWLELGQLRSISTNTTFTVLEQ